MPERQAAFDSLPVGVATVHTDGRVQRVNQCLAAWLGRPAEALVGRPVDECFTRASRVLYHTYVLPMLRLHGRLQELALQLEAGGAALPVLACALLERVAGVEQVQMVLSPMRERQRLEAELARARRAADEAPVVLFEFALDGLGRGSFGYVSAGLLGLYGVGPAPHLPEALVWERVHPDDLAGLMAARGESARTHQPWAWRYRVQPAGGSAWHWHDLQARLAPDATGGTVWHGTITDVTRQREMERAEQLRDAAQRANQAKSEFLARMSHELRTPLNGILGFAQLLQLDPVHGLHAEQRRRLQIIAASGQRLLALINEVLDISRIEAGQLNLALATVPLLPLLQQGVAAVEPMSAASGVAVALHCSPGCAVVADAQRLSQVLANLLSNAVKYNRPQGLVDVTVACRQHECVISVRDTGLGLSAEQQQQLFQPFNRLGAEGGAAEGTGLGLVITRHLVQAMGGRLEVASQPGQGSVFSVLLPVVDSSVPKSPGPMAQPLPAAGAAGQGAGPRRRVLCVEDNPVNALLLTQVLAGQAWLDLRMEASGEAALRTLAHWAPDLMLLDMHLGDMEGATLLARARALPGLAAVPAVAVSADAMPEHITRARAQGFCDYWTKPLDLQRLLADLQRLLAPPAAG